MLFSGVHCLSLSITWTEISRSTTKTFGASTPSCASVRRRADHLPSLAISIVAFPRQRASKMSKWVLYLRELEMNPARLAAVAFSTQAKRNTSIRIPRTSSHIIMLFINKCPAADLAAASNQESWRRQETVSRDDGIGVLVLLSTHHRSRVCDMWFVTAPVTKVIV